MLNRDRRKYYGDLREFIRDYTKQRRVKWLDTIDAINEILDEFYFPNEPRADKDEIKSIIKEYAEAQGETLADMYDVLDAVIQQELDDKIKIDDSQYTDE